MKILKKFHEHFINKSDVSKTLIFNPKTLITALITLTTYMSMAQDQMLYIHQDWLKPSKSDEYKNLTKTLVDEFKKHEFPYSIGTVYLSNGSVISATPIKNFADLDLNPYKEISEKIGAEKWKKIFEAFNGCYTSHNNFTVNYMSDLSYAPTGESMEGYNYYEYHFYYIAPGESKKMEDLIKSVKGISVNKNAPLNFSIYRSGFGSQSDYYVALISAKDEAHLKELADSNAKIIGEEGKKAIQNVYKSSIKYELILGWYMPDLSYNPKQ